MIEETMWLLESECCGNCGGALNPFESYLCHDCIENARYDEEQAMYDEWAWWDEDDWRKNTFPGECLP